MIYLDKINANNENPSNRNSNANRDVTVRARTQRRVVMFDRDRTGVDYGTRDW